MKSSLNLLNCTYAITGKYFVAETFWKNSVMLQTMFILVDIPNKNRYHVCYRQSLVSIIFIFCTLSICIALTTVEGNPAIQEHFFHTLSPNKR